ncbi:MAG: pyridoxal phosphate-dependent aminotransferase [Alphaproteobacteria bacterium]|jgi:aspartate aminotransferase|nr:pyridoxal phosphate-dependent aminotransferase [Alphaproteobacteria bacterium]MBT4020356.1 pyridoxal phosphate-dependent aminotransferase [Alphaproteobacteria bacterium]MBT5161432.1 pyridoxal phosphate-dependent aminotransferase [Alphaproteobacteria bacterium]
MTTSDNLPAPVRDAIHNLQASKIRAISREGMNRDDVLPLWFGEPNFPTPKFICDAAAEALAAGHTFYTENRGIPPLRSTLSGYMSNLYGVDVAEDRITTTVAAMNGIMLVMEAIVDPGDNVVIVAPLWPNCRETVAIMGGEPRAVDLVEVDGKWQLDLERLFAACDERTRAIFVNSPGNPTGWVMSVEQQQAVLEFCRKKRIWLLADEVYARLIFDRPYAPSFIEIAEPEDPVIAFNSFSKSWAMTGWRLGWLTAPPSMGEVFEKLNEYNISGPTTFVQHAAIVAIRDGEDFVKQTVEGYRQGRDLVYQRLSGMDRVHLPFPEAAFYAFFRVDGVEDSLELARKILNETGVGLAPGAAFGQSGEGYLRLCFAATPDILSSAMDRLEPILS